MTDASQYSEFQLRKVIPNLDGLRGISIVLVMFHHIPVVTTPFLRTLQINGRLGVMLFFVISGFLITYLGIKEKRKKKGFSLQSFYIRRSLRIFPLYYAVLALVCFFVYIANVYPPAIKKEFSEKIMSYVFYYSNLTGPIQGPFSLVWSLAVEEQFYLFFALIFYFFSVPAARGLFFLLTFLRITMLFWGVFVISDAILLRAFRYQEAIFLGVSLAFLLDIYSIFTWFETNVANYTNLFIAGLLVGFLLIGASSESYSWVETAVNTCFMLIVGISVLLPPIPFIGGNFLTHLGKISYGVYLFHTIIFYAIKRFVSDESWIVFCFGAPLTVWIATLSYNYYESFFLKLKNKFEPIK